MWPFSLTYFSSVTFLLAIFTIFTPGSSLHLHQASQTYIQYLIIQQNDLQTHLNKLQNTLTNNLNQINSELDIDKKIKLLENFLKQQRLELGKIALELTNKQINSSQTVCKDISITNKQTITKNLDLVKNDLTQVQNLMNKLTSTQINQSIGGALKEVQQTLELTSSLKDGLNAKVIPPTTTSVTIQKKTNLNGLQWMLDGVKIEDLNTEYKNAATKGVLELCPSEAPYLSSSGNCVNCNESGSKGKFFSLKTKQCSQCYNFDPIQHQCRDSQATVTNYNTPGLIDKLVVPKSKKIQDYIQADSSSTKISCPPSTPYYNGTFCISCEKYFNLETKKCVTCQSPSQYNLTSHRCEMKKLTISNLQTGQSTLIIPDDKNIFTLKAQYSQLNKTYQLIQCQTQKPFFNDVECISCGQGLYFNSVQKSCGTCVSGKVFNNLTNHCEFKQFISNLQINPNWSSSKNSTDVLKQVKNLSQNTLLYSMCTTTQPFSIGTSCIQCPQNQHFDYEKKQCLQCPSTQTFSVNLHKCIQPSTNYQTNPQTSPNLIYEGRAKNEWIYIYSKNVQANPSLLDCPSTSPFFDGKSCVNCPSNVPYFNLEYKICQKCSESTQYSAIHHDCLTTQGNIAATQGPTLQKMAAGIFA